MRKQKLKFSVLKLTQKQKSKIEEKSKNLGMSMNQMLIYAALEVCKIQKEAKDPLDSSIQIRLPEAVHRELMKQSEMFNMND